MDLKREVDTRPPRNAMGDFLFGTKLMMLVVGLAAGLPLGMIYAFQSGMHTCKEPIVVTISEVRTSPDPELDAYLEARQRIRDMSECRECHPADGKTLTLSDMELCRADEPSCRWVYGIDRNGAIRRSPNPRNAILLDPLRYESF